MHVLVEYKGQPGMSFIGNFQYLYFLVSLAAIWGSLVSLPSQKVYLYVFWGLLARHVLLMTELQTSDLHLLKTTLNLKRKYEVKTLPNMI